MPFVSIRLVAGQDQAKKDAVARKVATAMHESMGVPKEAVWVVFEDMSADEWYVGERSVAEIRKAKT
ncbi:MAG: 4-oxalocrotonate tautomerase family protein [Alphaproteobacteria bacterium]